MALTSSLFILGSLAILILSGLAISGSKQLWRTGLILSGVLLVWAQSFPALAALGAADQALNRGQQQLEETLKSTPTGDQYQGIEYALQPSRPQPLSDTEISRRIKSIRRDLVSSVSNGAVRLTGRVEDKATAQNIIDQIKEIPGVHEITFDLGLEHPTV